MVCQCQRSSRRLPIAYFDGPVCREGAPGRPLYNYEARGVDAGAFEFVFSVEL